MLFSQFIAFDYVSVNFDEKINNIYNLKTRNVPASCDLRIPNRETNNQMTTDYSQISDGYVKIYNTNLHGFFLQHK